MTYFVDEDTVTISTDDGLVATFTLPDITGLMAVTRLASIERPKPSELQELMNLMGGYLVEWNAADRNGPIEPGPEGIGKLRMRVFAPLLKGWVDHANGEVDADLKADSTSGVPLVPALSIPMEAL